MAELSEKSVDGELCLPSHFVPEEDELLFPSEQTYMDELAQQLSAYALLEQQQTQTKPNNQATNFQAGPWIRMSSSEANNVLGVEGNIHGTSAVRSHYALEQDGLVYQLPPLKTLTPIRGESYFVQAGRGSGVYHKQQIQAGSRFLPFQANASGFVRGTGVFFPRVDVTPTQGGRKQGLNNEKSNCKFPVRKNGNKNNSVGKKEVVVGLKATSEMGLPKEWTY